MPRLVCYTLFSIRSSGCLLHLFHATASFTLDKYGHVSERMRKESADRMDAYIEDNSKP